MAHIEVIYAGATYSIVNRDIDEVQREIEGILQTGGPGWIEAYDGHGSRIPSRLLISPGIGVALASLTGADDD